MLDKPPKKVLGKNLKSGMLVAKHEETYSRSTYLVYSASLENFSGTEDLHLLFFGSSWEGGAHYANPVDPDYEYYVITDILDTLRSIQGEAEENYW